MRLMTWNVCWRFGAWQERERGIVATLERVRPDIIALVETWADETTTQAQLLADRLGMPAAVFVPTSLPPVPSPPTGPAQAGTDMGVGLLSRWPVIATEIHDLPKTQRPGPPPIAMLAIVDHPRGPLRVIVTCLEWEPEYAQDQLAQSRALAALAVDPRLDGDLPVLLLGDLNAAVDQPDLAPLLDVMVDTWTAGGGDPNAVTLSSAVPEAPLKATKQIDRRIDHILARAGGSGATLTVRRTFLAGDHPIDGRYPSDHFAVVADLEP